METDEINKDQLDMEFEQLGAQAEGDPAEIAMAEQQGEALAAATATSEATKAEYKALLAGVLGPLPDVICPNWNITPPEVEALAESYGELLADYFPEGAGNMGPWAGAIMVTLAVGVSRVGVPMKLPPKPDEQPQVIEKPQEKPQGGLVDEFS